MKKLLSVIVLAAMIMSMSVIGTSAATIYMQDDFSGTDNNPENWIAEGTKYFVEGGMLQGYSDAVIHHTAYGSIENGQSFGKNRNWTTFVAEMDVRVVENDKPGSTQGIGLWIKAFDNEFMEGDGQVYNLGYDHTNSTYIIGRDTFDSVSDNAIVVVPTERWQEGADAPYHKLGAKVDASGMISLWVDGNKVAEVNTADAAATGSDKTSYTMGLYDTMVIIKNVNNFVQIDNFVVASPDYYTENVPVDPTTPDNPDNPGTSGDPSNPSNPGDPVAPSDPSNPSNPGNPANPSNPNTPTTPSGGANATDTNRNQNTSASTGDALYIAVAVAVAALGCALIVKKVNIK